jgi:hypothetical protein
LLKTKYNIEESGTIADNFLRVVVLPVPALASIIKSQSYLKALKIFSYKLAEEVSHGRSITFS